MKQVLLTNDLQTHSQLKEECHEEATCSGRGTRAKDFDKCRLKSTPLATAVTNITMVIQRSVYGLSDQNLLNLFNKRTLFYDFVHHRDMATKSECLTCT